MKQQQKNIINYKIKQFKSSEGERETVCESEKEGGKIGLANNVLNK